MLAMCLAAHSAEAVALDNSLESFTFRCSHNVHIRCVSEYIGNRKCVTELKLLSEIRLELDEFALRCGSCLFKMPLQRLAGMLLTHFVIGKLYSGITIILYCTDLRDYAWTSLNNGAWNVLSIGTENGSHSDFLSN